MQALIQNNYSTGVEGSLFILNGNALDMYFDNFVIAENENASRVEYFECESAEGKSYGYNTHHAILGTSLGYAALL